MQDPKTHFLCVWPPGLLCQSHMIVDICIPECYPNELDSNCGGQGALKHNQSRTSSGDCSSCNGKSPQLVFTFSIYSIIITFFNVFIKTIFVFLIFFFQFERVCVRVCMLQGLSKLIFKIRLV